MDDNLRNRGSMLITYRQQYQKTSNLSDAVPNRRLGMCLALSLFLGLAGCASAELPTGAAAQAQAAAPQHEITRASPAVIASAASQALVAAHESMEDTPGDTLAQLVPAARQASVLVSYSQYWLLRHQLSDDNEPVPTAAVKKFLSTTDNAWLADSIRGRWVVAAARSADFDTVNHIGSVVVDRSSVECSRLLARHMTGAKVAAADAMAAFQPNRSCWALFDQLVPNHVLGWNDIDPLLRATLETSKKSDARRLAGYLFDSSEVGRAHV